MLKHLSLDPPHPLPSCQYEHLMARLLEILVNILIIQIKQSQIYGLQKLGFFRTTQPTLWVVWQLVVLPGKILVGVRSLELLDMLGHV